MVQCSICLDENENDLYTTSCNHCFHDKCIKQWLDKKNTCPNCRRFINKAYVGSFSHEPSGINWYCFNLFPDIENPQGTVTFTHT